MQAPAVTFRREAAAAVNRTLADILAQHVSVLDFGAKGDCFGATEALCPHDATAAFNAALGLVSGGPLENKQTVHVPLGSYRIDGTLLVGCSLVLEFGATLHRIRVNATDQNTGPVVSLYNGGASLRGGGMVQTDLPSPDGVVNVGPSAGSAADYSVCFTLIEGIRIYGGGISQPRKPDGSLLPPQLQRLNSIGVKMHGVDTYQNLIRGLVVSDVVSMMLCLVLAPILLHVCLANEKSCFPDPLRTLESSLARTQMQISSPTICCSGLENGHITW
jgi:polygalacturonase